MGTMRKKIETEDEVIITDDKMIRSWNRGLTPVGAGLCERAREAAPDMEKKRSERTKTTAGCA